MLSQYEPPRYGTGNLLPIYRVEKDTMVVTFITQDEDGIHTHTGHVVCREPSTIILRITEPSSRAGRSVRVEIDSIIEEKVVTTS